MGAITNPNTPPSSEDAQIFSYSQFACIGSGFSAIAVGATLQRWYGIDDVRFFESQPTLGGTWFANQYPGCACDVPSALYSFSFESNADWSRVLPPNDELWVYLKKVADKYALTDKMTFNVRVEKCEWIEEKARWRMHVRNKTSGVVVIHECQFLFSGSGQFNTPRKLDVPGADRFEGPMFHSARWNWDCDLTGKRVVMFGNGCTGAQIAPAIVGKTKQLTQIVRSKHWIFPPLDRAIPPATRWLLAHIPGSMFISRLLVFTIAETDVLGQYMTPLGKA